jgi:hypothetical protein
MRFNYLTQTPHPTKPEKLLKLEIIYNARIDNLTSKANKNTFLFNEKELSNYLICGTSMKIVQRFFNSGIIIIEYFSLCLNQKPAGD